MPRRSDALAVVLTGALALAAAARADDPPDYDVRGPYRPAAPCTGDVSHR